MHPDKVPQAFSILLYDVKNEIHLSQLDQIASLRKLELERLAGKQHQQRELKRQKAAKLSDAHVNNSSNF